MDLRTNYQTKKLQARIEKVQAAPNDQASSGETEHADSSVADVSQGAQAADEAEQGDLAAQGGLTAASCLSSHSCMKRIRILPGGSGFRGQRSTIR